MTAPVPPDANGLREAVEAAEVRMRREGSDHAAGILREALATHDALAASEAAPTTGEEDPEQIADLATYMERRAEHNVVCEDFHTLAGYAAEWFATHPATPPADDASEGLSEDEQGRLLASIYSTLGTHRIKPHGADLHRRVVATANDIVAARTSAAATRAGERIARAEALLSAWEHDAPGLVDPTFAGRLREVLRRAPAPIRLRGSIARSDAAPHTGGES